METNIEKNIDNQNNEVNNFINELSNKYPNNFKELSQLSELFKGIKTPENNIKMKTIFKKYAISNNTKEKIYHLKNKLEIS